jgi:hypothetical protein
MPNKQPKVGDKIRVSMHGGKIVDSVPKRLSTRPQVVKDLEMTITGAGDRIETCH